ncbi:hypothetical protein [Actinokineospora cianjurensis]|uniref:Uncharacterized protein n=1 Tax=Actinokineospora cianjurensis TaxID=585224 RepID=A0A421B1L4_9PSEU|nr:hypothetical protein [Actinokineospora cianjurensis]RLK58247.1 hypothetical protein CLV68_4343 [Actinokineospora cianjurensis]
MFTVFYFDSADFPQGLTPAAAAEVGVDQGSGTWSGVDCEVSVHDLAELSVLVLAHPRLPDGFPESFAAACDQGKPAGAFTAAVADLAEVLAVAATHESALLDGDVTALYAEGFPALFLNPIAAHLLDVPADQRRAESTIHSGLVVLG